MSEESLEIVRRAITAVNERDLDAYLSWCTDDIQLSTPLFGGVYEGGDGIRRFFSDLGDAAPDFALTVERIEAVGLDRVLTFMALTATFRTSGIPADTETGNVYDLADGRIERVRIFAHRAEALEAAGLSE